MLVTTAVLLPAVLSALVLRVMPFHLIVSVVPARFGLETPEQLVPAGIEPLIFTVPEVTGYLVAAAGAFVLLHAVPASVPSVAAALDLRGLRLLRCDVGDRLVEAQRAVEHAVQLRGRVGSVRSKNCWSLVPTVLFVDTRTLQFVNDGMPLAGHRVARGPAVEQALRAVTRERREPVVDVRRPRT